MPLRIGLLLLPNLTQLDLTGPFEVFSRLDDAHVDLVWRTLDPIRADSGLQVLPTRTLADCPALDVVCVPGGRGVDDLLTEAQILDWLRQQAAGARYVAGICAGALLLGAAGLLRDRAATTHWASRHLLAHFGAHTSDARVVVDGNVITCAGVTAGIDLALQTIMELRGREAAEAIQLSIEYDPRPPVDAGSPDRAPAALVERLRTAMAPRMRAREQQVVRAVEALGRPGAVEQTV